jgi:HPt (histidine-containing phosphotransfer) domain-containing protein
MPIDTFAERLARVRQRFVSTLESKIEDTYADLPKLCGDGRDVGDALGETYRRIHGIVGIGPSVGFTATGKAAKALESVLREPYHATRGLAATEVDAFRKTLHALREAAQQELQATYSSWR